MYFVPSKSSVMGVREGDRREGKGRSCAQGMLKGRLIDACVSCDFDFQHLMKRLKSLENTALGPPDSYELLSFLVWSQSDAAVLAK